MGRSIAEDAQREKTILRKKVPRKNYTKKKGGCICGFADLQLDYRPTKRKHNKPDFPICICAFRVFSDALWRSLEGHLGGKGQKQLKVILK